MSFWLEIKDKNQEKNEHITVRSQPFSRLGGVTPNTHIIFQA